MKIFNLIGVLALTLAGLHAQPIVKNGSFENWHDSEGVKYPTHWQCDTYLLKNNIVKRVIPGSQGTYAVHLGSYIYDNTLWGAQIEFYDTLLAKPGSLQFDFKEFNNDNAFANGLIVKVVLYDTVGDYIDDYTWYSTGNQSIFKTVTLPISYPDDAAPGYVLINLYYFNFGGELNEYCIVDNLRFLNWVSDIPVSNENRFAVYPNPVSDKIMIQSGKDQNFSKAELLSNNGKSIEFTIDDKQIDISDLTNGIYTLLLYDEQGVFFGKRQISILR